MGRHDISLNPAGQRQALARGLYASTPVQTAFGWQAVAELGPGDLVMTQESGLVPVVAVHLEFRRALWSVRLPEGAVGNEAMLMLPPGQPILIKTHYALPFSGDDLALVPATALEGWRGIAPHVPACAEQILQLRLPRPAVIFAGPGILAGCEGQDIGCFDLKSLMSTPTRPMLPLAAARQMVAALIAEEAGAGFAEYYAAEDDSPPPNLA